MDADPELAPKAEWQIFDRSQPQRPVPPDRGIGRRIRTIAGMREELLDWVPEERARYTRVGLIIVLVGLMAALSLFAALHKMVGGQGILLVPICLFWAALVMTFDSWLISSTHGMTGRNRWTVFIPRLLISVLLGAAIAEPLVLWIFQPAIVKEVKAVRQTELDREESLWTNCNPVSGVRDTSTACLEYQLNQSDSPQAVREQLAQAKEHKIQLAADINTINARIEVLEQTAADECNGKIGRGLSGRVGEGPNCDQRRRETNTFRTVSGLTEKQQTLIQTDARIAELEGQVRTKSEAYNAVLAGMIQEKVEIKRASHGEIGMLEEMAALSSLSDRELAILIAHWVLTILLIAIDCMPVLVKALGGTTRYDHLVRSQLQAGTDMHGNHLSFQERSFDQERRTRIEELELRDREARASRRASTRQAEKELFNELYAQRKTARAPQTPPPRSTVNGSVPD